MAQGSGDNTPGLASSRRHHAWARRPYYVLLTPAWTIRLRGWQKDSISFLSASHRARPQKGSRNGPPFERMESALPSLDCYQCQERKLLSMYWIGMDREWNYPRNSEGKLPTRLLSPSTAMSQRRPRSFPRENPGYRQGCGQEAVRGNQGCPTDQRRIEQGSVQS